MPIKQVETPELTEAMLGEIETDHTQGAFRFHLNRRTVMGLCASLRAAWARIEKLDVVGSHTTLPSPAAQQCEVSVTGRHRIDLPFCKDCGQEFPLPSPAAAAEEIVANYEVHKDRCHSNERYPSPPCDCGAAEEIAAIITRHCFPVFSDEELEYIYLHCDFDGDRNLFLQIEKKIRQQIPKYREVDSLDASTNQKG
jgi:hypothetical protein